MIPPSYAMSFPPVETLDSDDSTSPYENSDLESAEPDLLLGPSAVNSASALKIGDNPLNLLLTRQPFKDSR